MPTSLPGKLLRYNRQSTGGSSKTFGYIDRRELMTVARGCVEQRENEPGSSQRRWTPSGQERINPSISEIAGNGNTDIRVEG
jgi:hypothetical protein